MKKHQTPKTHAPDTPVTSRQHFYLMDRVTRVEENLDYENRLRRLLSVAVIVAVFVALAALLVSVYGVVASLEKRANPSGGGCPCHKQSHLPCTPPPAGHFPLVAKPLEFEASAVGDVENGINPCFMVASAKDKLFKLEVNGIRLVACFWGVFKTASRLVLGKFEDFNVDVTACAPFQFFVHGVSLSCPAFRRWCAVGREDTPFFQTAQ